jgi:cell division protein FtsN
MKRNKTKMGWFLPIVTGYLFSVCGVLLGISFITQGEDWFQGYESIESLRSSLIETADEAAAQKSSMVVPPEHGLYTVQVGAFQSKERAARLQNNLRQQGYVPQIETPDQRSSYYRLRVGKFHQKAEASQFRDRLAGAGYDGFVRERF